MRAIERRALAWHTAVRRDVAGSAVKEERAEVLA